MFGEAYKLEVESQWLIGRRQLDWPKDLIQGRDLEILEPC